MGTAHLVLSFFFCSRRCRRRHRTDSVDVVLHFSEFVGSYVRHISRQFPAILFGTFGTFGTFGV